MKLDIEIDDETYAVIEEHVKADRVQTTDPITNVSTIAPRFGSVDAFVGNLLAEALTPFLSHRPTPSAKALLEEKARIEEQLKELRVPKITSKR